MPPAARSSWPVTVAASQAYVVTVRVTDAVGSVTKSFHLTVAPTYTATVSADIHSAPAGTPIPLHGQAVRVEDGSPMPNATVTIRIRTQGTRRVIQVVSDASGQFSTVFRPLACEAGQYEVGADHPAIATDKTDDTFTLYGMQCSPNSMTENLTPGQLPQTHQVTLSSLGDTPLTGVAATVEGVADNLSVQVNVPQSLPAFSQSWLRYTVVAMDPTIHNSTFTIRVTSTEGAVAVLTVAVTVSDLVPHLSASPSPVSAGMLLGGTTLVQVNLSNDGGVATGNVHVELPAASWMTLATPAVLPSIPAGGTAAVVLNLAPGNGLPLGPYTGTLVVWCDESSVTIPFTFTAISNRKGDLSVMATDEFTYFAAGSPKICGATVNVTDTQSGQLVAAGTTDSTGTIFFHDLTEAYYSLEVTAPDHGTFRTQVLVSAARLKEVEAFLPRQLVKYIWTVVPTQVEDQYSITIQATFETHVPAPVVTVEPSLIDLDQVGCDAQIDLTITNHGLVTAQAANLDFSNNNSRWQITPLVSQIGDIAAETSVVVPVLIHDVTCAGSGSGTDQAGNVSRLGNGSGGGVSRLDGDSGDATAPDPCALPWMDVKYMLICHGPIPYTVPVGLRASQSGCGGGTGGPGGYWGGTWGSGGGTFNTGGGGTGGGGTGGQGGPGSPGISGPSVFIEPTPCQSCADSDPPKDLLCLDMSRYLEPIADFIKGRASLLLKPFLGDIDLDVDISGKVCVTTCCVDKQVSQGLKGEAEVSIKADLPLAGRKFEIPEMEIAGYKVNGEVVLGCFVTPELKGTGSVDAGCGHEPDIKLTVSASDMVHCDAGWKFTIEDSHGYSCEVPLMASVALGAVGQVTYDNGKWTWDLCSNGLYLESDLNITCDILGQSLQFPPDDLGGRFYLIPCACINGAPCMPESAAANGVSPATLLASASGAVPLADPLGPPPDESPDLQQQIVDRINQDIAAAVAQNPSDAGLCARVQIQIDQQAVISRSGFKATLELENDGTGSLQDVGVTLTIKDNTGAVANDRFGIYPPQLTNISDVDGTGTVAGGTTASSVWTLVPSDAAAPTAPAKYYVGGTLTYTLGGQLITIPLFPAEITVLPNPQLHLKYFLEKIVYSDDPFTPEVEPAVPFSLGLIMSNSGAGVANDVRITSSQPKIVDNEKGLLVDFVIIGTKVGGQSYSPSLTVNLGDIGQGGSAVAQWLLTSSLEGQFIDYSATFEHVNGLGNNQLSLIDDVTILPMLHVVRIDIPADDGMPDFLAIDPASTENLPNAIHSSDGQVLPVTAVTAGTVDGVPGVAHTQLHLTAAMPAGWTYLRLDNPADGNADYRLAAVLRSDGRLLRMGDNVWTTHRVVRLEGQAPRVEDFLHIVDFDSTGSYTLQYIGSQPAADVTADVELAGSNLRFDRRTMQTMVTLTITNTSSLPISGPLQLVIDGLTPASASLAAVDGTTADGKSYLDFTGLLSGGVLAPGQAVSRQVSFNNPERGRLGLTYHVLGVAAVSSLAAPGFALLGGQTGDINGDNSVDVIDLLYLADAFGRVTGDANYDAACDINGDGSVDVVDLLILLDNWGK